MSSLAPLSALGHSPGGPWKALLARCFALDHLHSYTLQLSIIIWDENQNMSVQDPAAELTAPALWPSFQREVSPELPPPWLSWARAQSSKARTNRAGADTAALGQGCNPMFCHRVRSSGPEKQHSSPIHGCIWNSIRIATQMEFGKDAHMPHTCTFCDFMYQLRVYWYQ